MKQNLAGKKKLYTFLPSLQLYNNYLADKTITKEAFNLPFLKWPDGRPCNSVNLYMITRRDSPGRAGGLLSRHGKSGGTLGNYAKKLSQLIRYCHESKVDFLDLDDEHFKNFIHLLRQQFSTVNPIELQKNENTITSTGQEALYFLEHLGRLAGRDNFVSPTGVIKITPYEYTIKLRSGQNIVRTSYYHSSFSLGDAGDSRNPIKVKDIELIRTAINNLNTSRFINQRRHLHISFLEYLGPRAGEIAGITVTAINRAFKMKHPMLELPNFKQGPKSIRQIPVTRMLLTQARKFIKTQRAEAITKFTKKGRPDHDFLFISYNSGAPYAETGITNEMSILRRAAGIQEQACAHMFRHAFCTNLFVILFERYKFLNAAEFHTRLVTDEFFFADVMQWTGHSSLTGLIPYIHRAYSRVSKIPSTISTAHLILIYEEFDKKLDMLVKSLMEGMPKEEFQLEVTQLTQERDADIESALHQSQAD
jgi:site-specific recombinase XerD